MTAWLILGVFLLAAVGYYISNRRAEQPGKGNEEARAQNREQAYIIMQERAENLKKIIPGLPDVPQNPFDLGIWLSDIFKRADVSSKIKTAQTMTELCEKYVQFLQTYGEYKRTRDKQDIADEQVKRELALLQDTKLQKKEKDLQHAKLDAELARLKLEKEKHERERANLQDPPPQRRPETAEEKLVARMRVEEQAAKMRAEVREKEKDEQLVKVKLAEIEAWRFLELEKIEKRKCADEETP